MKQNIIVSFKDSLKKEEIYYTFFNKIGLVFPLLVFKTRPNITERTNLITINDYIKRKEIYFIRVVSH